MEIRKLTMKTACAAAMMIPLASHADQWVGPFAITNLFVPSGENYHYRLYGMPAVSACVNGTNWAYINESDSGSKGKIAAILMAYSTGRPVSVYVQVENGFCHAYDLQIPPQ